MSSPATSCARRCVETASSYCSRQRALTIASRKLRRPSCAVCQAGRGSEPMIEVGSTMLADALYTALSPWKLCCELSPHRDSRWSSRDWDQARASWIQSVHLSDRITGAAALRANDHIMSAAADRFANQAMIVALPMAGRCVEQINAKIERPVGAFGDQFGAGFQ